MNIKTNWPILKIRWLKPKPFIVIIFMLITFSTVCGQINNSNYKVDLSSTSMGPCQGNNNGFSTVGILAKKITLNSFKISFNFPVGVDYKVGSLIINSQNGSGDLVATEYDISNLNTPMFQIERPSNSNWQIADFIEFTFEKNGNM